MKHSHTNNSSQLLSREAHVWHVVPESVCDPAILQHFRDILNTEEREKLVRFVRPEDSHHYLVVHALVRSVLSYYTNIAPSDWCFTHGKHGRPEIHPDTGSRLRFNLTHTRGLVACVVTLDVDCGIDAELLCERSNPLGVAKRMFSPPELEALGQREGGDFLDYFYEHWTLREAYVKARGIGISFPTRRLCFNTEGKKVSVEFDDTVDDCEKNWHFQLIRPNATHIVSLALRSNSDEHKDVVVCEWGVKGDRFRST